MLVRKVTIGRLIDEQRSTRLQLRPDQRQNPPPFGREKVFIYGAEHHEIERPYFVRQTFSVWRHEETNIGERSCSQNAFGDLYPRWIQFNSHDFRFRKHGSHAQSRGALTAAEIEQPLAAEIHFVEVGQQ